MCVSATEETGDVRAVSVDVVVARSSTDDGAPAQLQLQRRKRNKLVLWFPGLLVLGLWGVYVGTRRPAEELGKSWFVALIMVAGSFVAGATPLGGSAVAFPALTLTADIEATAARTFGLMIQSIGMTSASYYIFCSNVRLAGAETLALACYASSFGVVAGLELDSNPLPGAVVKLLYANICLVFSTFLVWLRLKSGNADDEPTPEQQPAHLTLRGAAQVAVVAFAGGLVSSLVGSGTDILLFTYLVVTGTPEQVAQPTSVVAMAWTSIVGTMWKVIVDDVEKGVLNFLMAAGPVVAFGAPFGAAFIKKKGKAYILCTLIVLAVIQYVAVLVLVDMPVAAVATQAVACIAIVAATLHRAWITMEKTGIATMPTWRTIRKMPSTINILELRGGSSSGSDDGEAPSGT